MNEILIYLETLANNIGYSDIFIMMVLESSFIPFPSEIAMVPAGFQASIWDINFILAFLSWTAWAIIWATINYLIWYQLWENFIKKFISKYWKYFFIKVKHYNKAELYFENHWSITVFTARFIPAVRQLISLPAWVFKMWYAKFFFYTWLGAWIWNLTLMTIWYIAWENKELIKQYLLESLIWGIIFISLIWAIYYFIKYKNATKK